MTEPHDDQAPTYHPGGIVPGPVEPYRLLPGERVIPFPEIRADVADAERKVDAVRAQVADLTARQVATDRTGAVCQRCASTPIGRCSYHTSPTDRDDRGAR